MTTFYEAERDCLVSLGILASTYKRFDPRVILDGTETHSIGFNVHCLIVDNTDGEVLALERNLIHADLNPLQHAEQLGVRAGIKRLLEKRPRDLAISVEKYYKGSLFMAPGVTEEAFRDTGCTLYNTFDPCGMCAVTLLVAYMKRIKYVFDDDKFAEVYDQMRTFFGGRESVKEPIQLLDKQGAHPLTKGSNLIGALQKKVKDLKASGTQLVMTLDECQKDIEQIYELFQLIEASHIVTPGVLGDRNRRTLSDLKRLIA